MCLWCRIGVMYIWSLVTIMRTHWINTIMTRVSVKKKTSSCFVMDDSILMAHMRCTAHRPKILPASNRVSTRRMRSTKSQSSRRTIRNKWMKFSGKHIIATLTVVKDFVQFVSELLGSAEIKYVTFGLNFKQSHLLNQKSSCRVRFAKLVPKRQCEAFSFASKPKCHSAFSGRTTFTN